MGVTWTPLGGLLVLVWSVGQGALVFPFPLTAGLPLVGSPCPLIQHQGTARELLSRPATLALTQRKGTTLAPVSAPATTPDPCHTPPPLH